MRGRGRDAWRGSEGWKGKMVRGIRQRRNARPDRDSRRSPQRLRAVDRDSRRDPRAVEPRLASLPQRPRAVELATPASLPTRARHAAEPRRRSDASRDRARGSPPPAHGAVESRLASLLQGPPTLPGHCRSDASPYAASGTRRGSRSRASALQTVPSGRWRAPATGMLVLGAVAREAEVVVADRRLAADDQVGDECAGAAGHRPGCRGRC